MADPRRSGAGERAERGARRSPHAALVREHIDLVTLVHDVVAELPHEDQVELDLPPEVPLMSLDRTRMRLLLRNLLDNALRHSAQAPAPPCVSVSFDDDGGVTLAVRDFGPGVDDAVIGHLAEPFYRPDASRERGTLP